MIISFSYNFAICKCLLCTKTEFTVQQISSAFDYYDTNFSCQNRYTLTKFNLGYFACFCQKHHVIVFNTSHDFYWKLNKNIQWLIRAVIFVFCYGVACDIWLALSGIPGYFYVICAAALWDHIVSNNHLAPMVPVGSVNQLTPLVCIFYKCVIAIMLSTFVETFTVKSLIEDAL